VGKEKLARVWQPSNVQEFADGTLVVQRRKVKNDWCRVENEHLWVTNGEVTDVFRFSHTVYSGQELKTLLLDTGFEKVDLYGDFEGGEYGLGATRQVAVARKSES
jgi:hypothetical protein